MKSNSKSIKEIRIEDIGIFGSVNSGVVKSLHSSQHISCMDVCKSAQIKDCEHSPFTFRLAEHLALAALYATSPV